MNINSMTFLKANLILLVLTAAMAMGQPGTAAEVIPERPKIQGRKAWIMCTSIPEKVPNPVSVLVDGEVHKITLSIRHMSDPFPIRGDGAVRLIKTVPDPKQEGKMTFDVLAQAVVPKTTQEALIIMAPAPSDSKHAFQCKVLDLKEFQGGDYMYLNLSPRKIVITLGEEKQPLEPGSLEIQTNREIRKATNTPLSFHYFSENENKWKLITATTVVVQPTRREICVFSWDSERERIQFKGATFPVEPPH